MLSDNAQAVLRKRYFTQHENELPVEEAYSQLCKRVANFVAKDVLSAHAYEKLMREQLFLPNSPCLMGAGTDMPQLFACFVLPVGDSIESIFDAVKNAALIHKSGGGTGFSFSELRPTDAYVRSTRGVASGPVSFMKIFNAATEQIKQGGRRKGANMGVLRADHPDIFRFINAKWCEGDLNNFNISVAFPHLGGYSDVLDAVAEKAWYNGEPGCVFLRNIRVAAHPSRREAEATNPCGEFPAMPYEPCVLGSINVSKFVRADGTLDEKRLASTARRAQRFLDDCIDASHYPLPEVEKAAKYYRSTGLGMMGLADALFKAGLPYNSTEGRAFAARIAEVIQKAALYESEFMAVSRGPAPASKDCGDVSYVRNVARTAVAPTGTLSLIANCSPGIEPVFSIVTIRNVMDGMKLREYNPYCEAQMKREGVSSPEELSPAMRNVFVTAMDIPAIDHVLMQADIQKHVDHAVSKTINLPHHATVQDVRDAFEAAYWLGCKGVTVYRDGSRDEQVYQACSLCD